jgi:hypothetical protein
MVALLRRLRLRSYAGRTKATDTRQYFYRSLCLLVVLAYGRVVCMHGQSPSVAAQSDPATKAPADVKPGSISYEDVPYPYLVMYLPLTLYGQDVRMAYMVYSVTFRIRGNPNTSSTYAFCTPQPSAATGRG